MKLHTRIAALFLLMAGATLGAGQTQPPVPQPPTFKVEVDYVEVDVVVNDKQGNLVRDLKKEDFQVMEDGKAQTISAFTLVDIPIERPDRPLFTTEPLVPDVQTNERAFEGRVYVMVIDDMHTRFGRTPRVKLAAKQGLTKPGTKATAITDWLKADYKLGHGHAMAVVKLLKDKGALT